MHRIVLLGSGPFFEMASVVLCKNKNLEVIQYNLLNSKFRTLDLLDKAVDLKPDAVFCISFERLIPKKYLSHAKFINFHPSILPKYRGRHSVVWAILNNEEFIGYTIHEINQWMDDGKIIYTFKTKNNLNITSNDFFSIFLNDFKNNIDYVIANYLKGDIELFEQNKLDATWVPKRLEIDLKIDFSNDVNYYSNLWRALMPRYSAPYFCFKGLSIEIRKMTIRKSGIMTSVGAVVNIDDEGVWITCKDGYLVIQEAFNRVTLECIDYSFFNISKRIDDCKN